MNINNQFAGLFGLLIGVTMVYWFWNPIVTFISELPAGVQVIASAAAIMFVFILLYLNVIMLTTSDEQ